MTRQTKTPKQRAEEALALANRKVIRLDHDVDRLQVELITKTRERDEAVALQAHARQHPALQTPTSITKEVS